MAVNLAHINGTYKEPRHVSNQVVLCAGNKGGNEKRFYKQMLPLADTQFTTHLKNMENNDDQKSK